MSRPAWARVRPALVDTAVLGLLVGTGLVPAPLLVLGLAVPLAVVCTFAALDAAFSSTLPGPRPWIEGVHARLLPMVAYLAAGASLAMATTMTWPWTAWYGLAAAVVYAFVRLWRDSVRHGSLFPEGYGPVWWDALALAAALATVFLLEVHREVLPALPLLAVRLVGEVVTAARSARAQAPAA